MSNFYFFKALSLSTIAIIATSIVSIPTVFLISTMTLFLESLYSSIINNIIYMIPNPMIETARTPKNFPKHNEGKTLKEAAGLRPEHLYLADYPAIKSDLRGIFMTACTNNKNPKSCMPSDKATKKSKAVHFGTVTFSC